MVAFSTKIEGKSAFTSDIWSLDVQNVLDLICARHNRLAFVRLAYSKKSKVAARSNMAAILPINEDLPLSLAFFFMKRILMGF